MPFETPFSVDAFGVNITSVHHEIGVGVPPLTIIKTDQSWSIHVNWETTGLATTMIGGTWHLHAYLESMGLDPDVPIPSDLYIPLTPGPSPVVYFRDITVSPNIVSIPPGSHDSKLYKLVVAMTYLDLTGAPGPMAGFVEGPMLQFYNP